MKTERATKMAMQLKKNGAVLMGIRLAQSQSL